MSGLFGVADAKMWRKLANERQVGGAVEEKPINKNKDTNENNLSSSNV